MATPEGPILSTLLDHRNVMYSADRGFLLRLFLDLVFLLPLVVHQVLRGQLGPRQGGEVQTGAGKRLIWGCAYVKRPAKMIDVVDG